MRQLSRLAACITTLALVAPPARAQTVEAPKLTLLEQRDAIASTARERVQGEILDRLFGAGKASAFVDVELELKASRRENMRFGAGAAEKNKIKEAAGAAGALKTTEILPGVPRPKNIMGQPEAKPPEAAQTQTAEQTKTDQELIYAQNLDIKKFVVTVIYDAVVPEAKVKAARELIVDALKTYDVKAEDVVFRPADYDKPKKDWRADLMDPKVYLPLLYALLTLLFLVFLFGPLARFFKRYVEALVQKPAAEINVESNITPPEEEEGKGGLDETLKSQVEMLVGRKPAEPSPPPPPPPPDEEDEEGEEGAMGKKEPFSYINDANLKNLANLFLLRAEEPWLIAVVLSYLRPEYARQVLTSLPVELQAKVALEALKVRQVTREQILAIDADVKENIDYVVGGIERLIQMLEEADTRTRANILDYLQNDKPAVFEYVRKKILLFEDIARFPDREMQAVVRGLKTDVMAKALHGAPPEVANKFFANMSAGASSLVKEQMEYQKDLTPVQVEEERARIMDQVKLLEKEGKINIRGADAEAGGFHQVIATESVRGSRLSQLSGPAPAPAPAPAASEDPVQAKRWYESGLQSMEAGDLDAAVKSFRQAVELDHQFAEAYNSLGQALYQMGRYSEAIVFYENFLRLKPDPELQSWVDSVKQSQTGTGA